MGKLPYGVPNKHVKASHGGDSDVMKFYCTQNATTYGKAFSNFKPQTTRHTGTGYQSNFRPGVYYSSKLDSLDNPTMGKIVSDNYHSVTEKCFRPYSTPSGKESLPNRMNFSSTGFTRQKPLTISTVDEVNSVCIDTRAGSAPVDHRPRYKPRLHHLQAKDPVELENGGYGPSFMSTETQERFRGAQPNRSDNSRKSVGYKENSGFTHNKNVEPVSFHAEYAHKGDAPDWLTDRPTGFSIMKSDFRPTEHPKGNERFPKLANRSCHDTGFTSGTKALPVFVNRVPGDAYDKAGDIAPMKLDRMKKQDPTEYLNATHPDNKSSVCRDTYTRKPFQQFPDSGKEADRLGNTAVGTKEETGFSENGNRWYATQDNPARFVTHYQTKFVDRTPQGKDREGHTWGSIQHQLPDGYTKSTAVHSFGTDIDSTATLRRMEPYVARSTMARDPFFDEHKFDSKIHSKLQVA